MYYIFMNKRYTIYHLPLNFTVKFIHWPIFSGPEILSIVSGFLILSPDIPLDVIEENFYFISKVSKAVRKWLKYQKFCDPFSVKYFAPLKILYLSIKSFVSSFVDISLKLFSFFSTSKFFYLKQLFVLIFTVFSSKYVFFSKSAISSLVAKFAYFNVSAKCSLVHLLLSLVVIYLSFWGVIFSRLQFLCHSDLF